VATQEHTPPRHSAAVEDYTKAIYALQARGSAVSTNALAERLGVTAGSVSAMAKKLAELGLVQHTPYHGMRLTGEGERVALEIMRHHRLLELFLAEVLEVPRERVHEEAEVLEHYISEDIEELIAAKLGHPTHDPHGEPIPDRELRLHEPATESLQALGPGETGTFVRVWDRGTEMLRFLSDRGIAPGAGFEVVDKQPFDGPLFVRFGEEVHVIGGALARAMRVRRHGGGAA
jgi:DtxR family Mn-dependent transcriptional regulator